MTVPGQADAVMRQWRPHEVTQQSLEPTAVICTDTTPCVQIEAVRGLLRRGAVVCLRLLLCAETQKAATRARAGEHDTLQ